jgi:hypothetical protein
MSRVFSMSSVSADSTTLSAVSMCVRKVASHLSALILLLEDLDVLEVAPATHSISPTPSLLRGLNLAGMDS